MPLVKIEKVYGPYDIMRVFKSNTTHRIKLPLKHH